MSQRKKKIPGILLAVVMMLGMMPAVGFSVYAESADSEVLREETTESSDEAFTEDTAAVEDEKTDETAEVSMEAVQEDASEQEIALEVTAEAFEEPSETEAVKIPRLMLKKGPVKAPARTVTSETVHISEPLSDIADYGKPVVSPTFTLESSDITVRTDYSMWMRFDGESWKNVTETTFGEGTYAYRLFLEGTDSKVSFDSASSIDIDGTTWMIGNPYLDHETGLYGAFYQSPSIEISGQYDTPKAIFMPSSGERFALWTKVEGATSYDLIITNKSQLYPRSKTINVTSWYDWHEHDPDHLQQYDLWVDLAYILPDITVKSGNNTYSLQVIAKGPKKADSAPSKINEKSYEVITALDNVAVDANGRLTWDPYTNAADPEAKIYHINIYRPDGSFLVDVWRDSDQTFLNLEAFIEKYGRVNGKYRVELSGWDARENAGGWQLTGTMLRFYEYTPKIKTLSIDGLKQPREGELAQIYLGDLSVAEEHVYLPKDGDGSGYWQYQFGTIWPSMLPTDAFEATGTYRASIPILYDKDYAIADNAVVKVNGQEVAAEIESIGDIGGRHAARVYCPMSVILNNSSTYVVTAGSLNVRAAANTSSDRVGGLSYGDVVEAKGQMGGFIQIDYEGGTAWVASKYLALTYSREAAIKPLTYTVQYGAVNVRSAPDQTADNRIGGYTNGKEILVTGRVTDADGNVWVTVDYNDGSGRRLGFVMEKYLHSGGSLEGTPPPIVSAEEDTDDTDLEVDTGVDAKISFEWLSAKPKITEGDKVSLGEENFIIEEGSLITTVYPDDATNFSSLAKANVKLPAGLTDAGYELADLILNTDGSITLKIGLKDPVVVTFDVNGHGTAPAAQTLARGKQASRPEDPEEEGYTFYDFWYTDPACTTEFNFSTPITEDITLYAKWMVNVIGLNLHANGTKTDGTYYLLNTDTLEPVFEKDVEEAEVRLGHLCTDSACSDVITTAPEKGTTYYFRVYMKDVSAYEAGKQLIMFLPKIADHIDASAMNAVIELDTRASGEPWIIGSATGDAVTLQFKYMEKEDPKPAAYAISYDLNGGKLDGKTGIVTVSVEEGSTITLPTPARDGYTFDYWEGSHYDAGDSYKVEGDHTFTAQWKKNSTPSNPGKTDENKPGGRNNAPNTEDKSHMALYAGLMLLALLGIGGVLISRKRFTD